MGTSTPPPVDPQRILNDTLAAPNLPFTTRDHASLSMAADLHTISRITQIWSDRLQLISVYASFFTSIDSVLFSLASSKDHHNTASKLMLSSLVGALIFHAAAAILAYVAAFVLIRYKLNGEESTNNNDDSHHVATVYAKYARSGPTSVDPLRTPSALESGNGGSHEKVEHIHNSHAFGPHTSPFLFGSPFFSNIATTFTSLLEEPPSLNIDLRRVSLFNFGALLPCIPTPVQDGDKADAEKNAKSLVRLLNRCHRMCSIFALVGFILVLVGIISYVWAALEHTVAIFGSACVGVCMFLGFAALY